MRKKFNSEIHGNCYYNQILGFYIEKPSSWAFMPKTWAHNMKEIALENNPELKDMFAKAARAFLTFRLLHDDKGFIFPSVECSCRMITSKKEFEPVKFIQDLYDLYNNLCDNVKIVEAFDNFTISGYKGVFLKLSYDIYKSDDEPIKCLTRLIAINRPVEEFSLMYSIGLKGNLEGEFCCEEEFSKIIKSIAIE